MPLSLSDRNEPIEVLLVEDNSGDARLMKEMFKSSKRPIGLNVAQDGLKALEMLHWSADCGLKRKPDMVILDLDLPLLTGLEVLRIIRRDSELKEIPILVMSGSYLDMDVQTAYECGANFFIAKPMDLGDFQEVMNFIVNFFFERIDRDGNRNGITS